MRESTGSALLLNIVIVFSGIIILFFIGIISYSKAYRVKNRIVDIIEKYGVYNDKASKEINESLSEAGYSLANKDFCTSNRVQKHLKNDVGLQPNYGNIVKNINDNTKGYNYCVFEVTSKTTSTTSGDNAKYYIIVTFVHFNFPIVGDLINMPIYGETKILGRNYNY